MRESFLPQGSVFKPGKVTESDVQPSARPRSLLVMTAIFIGLFAMMQLGWSSARSTWVERLVIDQITVKPAAWLITRITPEIPVLASGPHLKAPGGGINILNGCDGMEVIFLLVAAMLIAPIPIQWRLTGAAIGSVMVYIFNQGRILALFYAYRTDRPLFDLLHGMITPILLVVVATGFYFFWLDGHRAVQLPVQEG